MGAGTSHYILLGLYFNVYYYIPFIFTFANMDFLKVTFAVVDREFGIHVLQRSFTTLFADIMSTKRLRQQQVYESFLRSQIHFLVSRKLGGGWGKGGTFQDFRWYTHLPCAINAALHWEFVCLLRIFGISVDPSCNNQAVSLYNFAAPSLKFQKLAALWLFSISK